MDITVMTAADSYRARVAFLSVALALLLALAGCGGVEFGASDTGGPAKATEWPEAETIEAEPLGETTLPPGVNESGVMNASRLLAAHRENFPAAPYRIRMDSADADLGQDTTLVLAQTEARARLRRSISEEPTTYWASGEQLVVAVDDGSGVTYARGRTPTADRMLELSSRARTGTLPYVRFGELEVVGAVTLDERRYVKLRLTGLNSMELAASPWEPADSKGTVKGATGWVLVSTDGVVSQSRIEVTYERDDAGLVTDTLRYRLSDEAKVDIQRPEWISRAPHVVSSLSEDGTRLVLENVGQRPIVAGTELEMRTGKEELGVVQVPERIGPDERLYVTATRGEVDETTSVQAHVDPPAPTNQMVDFDRYDTLVIEGRSEVGTFQVGSPIS